MPESTNRNRRPRERVLTRRDVIKGAALTVTGAALSGCASAAPPSRPTPTPAPLTPVPTPRSAVKAMSAGRPKVAIARAASYDPALVRQQVYALLDLLGGLGDVVKAGDKVGIKLNLTGGGMYSLAAGEIETETYITHPAVVQAFGEALLDLGVKAIYLMDALFADDSFTSFGYDEVARALGAYQIDLNLPYPYDDFVEVPVGEGHYLYESFKLNPLLQEIDAFVSVSKMKCHYSAGVTHTMKNLVGIAPVQFHRLRPNDNWRSGLHGNSDEVGSRLPRAIVDLNRARPVNFGLVDGIMAAEGGEVPRGSFSANAPGLLLAGKNPVAVDAVATACQGFDPTTAAYTTPFLHCDNHLALANEKGLGPNKLDEIDVVGEQIKDVVYPFKPSITA